MSSLRFGVNKNLAHLRLVGQKFPNNSFEFNGILHVGPTKSLTFGPGDLRVAMKRSIKEHQ